MNKLREKFENVYIYIDQEPSSINCRLADTSDIDSVTQCEQITDDFSVKFAEFLYDHRRNNQTMFWKPAKEILQIFKTQYYGKE